ncbi:hypothetical protein CPB86DRAFT_591273 [Serendipita vermifera]|nr:hypothetical protein CPB86DRAFT_591273 [Serendipita vermifera]
MLGGLRMTIKDAMKELHTLGSKLRMGETDVQASPTERLDALRDGIKEMLRNQELSEGVDLQDQRFSSSKCKVQASSVVA